MSTELLRHWFAQPWGLALYGLLPVLLVAAFIGWRRRRRRLMRMGRVQAVVALASRRRPWQRLRRSCFLMGLLALIVGVAGPQWGREPLQVAAKGRDLIVVLDMSRSMLADDVSPDPHRFERARRSLIELSQLIQRKGGHRLGLVVFAAYPKVICPLTHDYEHFRNMLKELDPDHPPHLIRPGYQERADVSGTRMGGALRAAVDTHDFRFPGYQDILLISDGDDPVADEEWRGGVSSAAGKGIPVYTAGIGDPVIGGRIPVPDGVFQMKEGKLVRSRLNEALLKEIARITKGQYLEARTGPVRLSEWFASTIEPGPQREVTDDTLPVYRQRFTWFFAAALLFLSAEMTLGGRHKKKPAQRDKAKPVVRN